MRSVFFPRMSKPTKKASSGINPISTLVCFFFLTSSIPQQYHYVNNTRPRAPNPARRIMLRGGERYAIGILGEMALLERNVLFCAQSRIALSRARATLLLGPHDPAKPLTPTSDAKILMLRETSSREWQKLCGSGKVELDLEPAFRMVAPHAQHRGVVSDVHRPPSL